MTVTGSSQKGRVPNGLVRPSGTIGAALLAGFAGSQAALDMESNGRIGPVGFLDPTIVAVNGVELEVFEAGRRDDSMTRAASGTYACRQHPLRLAE